MRRGPDRDFLIFAWTVALIICFLVWGASQAQGSWRDKRIDALASWLAGRDVIVRCLTLEEARNDELISFWGASAYVDGYLEHGRWHPYDAAVFKVGICERLRDVMNGDASRWSVRSVAWAVLVLTHESGHLRGGRYAGNEARTECWAIQHVQAVGRRLGLTPLSLLQNLANEQHLGLPAQYHRPCRIPIGG